MVYVNIAKDFSASPGGRYKKDGPNSGEEFRDNILIPKYKEAIEKDEWLYVNLDGVFGYPVSFLDEAFGGLIIKEGNDKLSDILMLVSEDEPYLIKRIYEIMNEARIRIGIEPRTIPIKKSKINYKILLKATMQILIGVLLMFLFAFTLFRHTELFIIISIVGLVISIIIFRYDTLMKKEKEKNKNNGGNYGM